MAPAFTVQGVPISAEQRDAGLAAMRGMFNAANVAGALIRAGVPQRAPDNIVPRPVSADYVPERAADRLLQSERKAGRIRAINNKNWERVEP